MTIYFGEPREVLSLEYALKLAPSWENMYISRFQNGWVFVNSHGVYFVTDEGERGWVPTEPEQSDKLYKELGKRRSQMYYEQDEKDNQDDRG